MGFWWGHLKARDQLVDTGIEETIILKYVLKIRWRLWTGLIWLRIETGGRLM